MARKDSITTARILAGKALEERCSHQCVDWAIGLLAQGHSGRYLQMLASLAAPLNHFEVADLRDRTLRELNIPELKDTDAVLAYARERLSAFVAGEESLERTLADLKDLCIVDDYNRDLYDFYSLYYAHSDLKIDKVQRYWNGATRDNIEQIIRDRAQTFLKSDLGRLNWP